MSWKKEVMYIPGDVARPIPVICKFVATWTAIFSLIGWVLVTPFACYNWTFEWQEGVDPSNVWPYTASIMGVWLMFWLWVGGSSIRKNREDADKKAAEEAATDTSEYDL